MTPPQPTIEKAHASSEQPAPQPGQQAAVDGTNSVADLCVLIPAYKPTEDLIELVDTLRGSGYGSIVLVDDGSGEEFLPIFEALSCLERVTVLRHAVNLGKGAALRYGLNHIAVHSLATVGVLTADADGQHLPNDILKVGQSLIDNPASLIMGSRSFQGPVPLRSRVGNTATQYVFKLFAPSKLSDTQTGLRGIPLALIPPLLKIPGNRYDYEMRMLIELKILGVEMVECEIETVYEDDNSSSHFLAVRDSMRIYSVFARFLIISFATFLIDVVVFTFMVRMTDNIALSMATARIVAGVYQFHTCRVFVFKSGRPVASSAFWYAVLVAMSGFVSYALMTAGTTFTELDVVLLKIISETMLIIANFSIQRLLIFPMTPSSSGSDRVEHI